MDIRKVIVVLTQLATMRPERIVWANENRWAVDALRGSLHEIAWRGTLTEYFDNNPSHVTRMALRAITRLKRLDRRMTENPLPSVFLSGYAEVETLRGREIGLGTYGWKYDPAIISRAMDLGIGLIDTAETYGYGRVEEALGKALRAHPRSMRDGFLVLATKVSRTHLSYDSIIRASNRSRHRLDRRLDLYQIHRPNPKYPLDITFDALGMLYRKGIIGAIGVCNLSVDQLINAQYELWPARLSSIQVRYNLMDRGIERALLPYCQTIELPVIAYSPLGQKFPKSMVSGMSALAAVAKDHRATEAQIALAWLMEWQGVIPIPRTNNVSHVDEIAESVHIELDGDDVHSLAVAFPITE